MGDLLWKALESLENLVQIRGRGLMIGLDLTGDSKPFRHSLLKEQYVFVGSAAQSNTSQAFTPPWGESG